jgi:succinate dehydrogenase/fumarate reductase flavoprotein subunit
VVSATPAGLGAVEYGAAQSDAIRKQDIEAGVVVHGIGAAGLMTAITAYDKGSDVMILEKAPEAHAGGNTPSAARVAGVLRIRVSQSSTRMP